MNWMGSTVKYWVISCPLFHIISEYGQWDCPKAFINYRYGRVLCPWIIEITESGQLYSLRVKNTCFKQKLKNENLHTESNLSLTMSKNMTAWLARVENLSHTTWCKHNWMLFEAHSQAAIDQCRFIISIKSPRKNWWTKLYFIVFFNQSCNLQARFKILLVILNRTVRMTAIN